MRFFSQEELVHLCGIAHEKTPLAEFSACFTHGVSLDLIGDGLAVPDEAYLIDSIGQATYDPNPEVSELARRLREGIKESNELRAALNRER